MSFAQQPFTDDSIPTGAPTVDAVAADVLASQRIALDYERAALRKWLYRLSFLVLTVAGLLLEAFAVLVGGLIAAGDALQLYAKIPSDSATILQGLLFVAALATTGLLGRRLHRG